DQAQIAVTRLSTSARRRLAFARAVLSQPRLLLLDQPSLRADLATQELFAHLIRQVAEAGALVLLMEEDLAWASTCCTRVIELEDGHLANAYVFRCAAQRDARRRALRTVTPRPSALRPSRCPRAKMSAFSSMIPATSSMPPAGTAKPTCALQ